MFFNRSVSLPEALLPSLPEVVGRNRLVVQSRNHASRTCQLRTEGYRISNDARSTAIAVVGIIVDPNRFRHISERTGGAPPVRKKVVVFYDFIKSQEADGDLPFWI